MQRNEVTTDILCSSIPVVYLSINITDDLCTECRSTLLTTDVDQYFAIPYLHSVWVLTEPVGLPFQSLDSSRLPHCSQTCLRSFNLGVRKVRKHFSVLQTQAACKTWLCGAEKLFSTSHRHRQSDEKHVSSSFRKVPDSQEHELSSGLHILGQYVKYREEQHCQIQSMKSLFWTDAESFSPSPSKEIASVSQ